ncbi:helix-turn-helix domain-containing protein, partial [Limnohabitans sp. DM1]|uniref:helix-turn-helix domain-containing protein n=1 Tax=Limnohabitans sp. DM1 TaxID=1597955 RepID=UPI000ABC49BB
MYKHLSREERYQIHSLLKAKQTITEIARSLGRSRSTISRELSRGRGQRGYRAEQACAKATERAQQSRNARRVDSKVWSDVDFYLGIQWSPDMQPAPKHAMSGLKPPTYEKNCAHVSNFNMPQKRIPH